MKKFFLIILAITLIGCFKDDDNKDCKCTMKVYVSDGTTTSQYFIEGVESDCNGKVIEDLDLPGDHFPTMNCE